MQVTATDAANNASTQTITVTVTNRTVAQDGAPETTSLTVSTMADASIAENIAYPSVTPNLTGTPHGAVTWTPLESC